MQIPFEIGMTNLDLESAVAKRVGTTEQLHEGVVAQVKIETGNISRHAIAPAAQQLVERQAHLLGSQVPERPAPPHGRAGRPPAGFRHAAG